MHIIRNVDANITTDWYELAPGEYTLVGLGTLGGGTLKLQIGVMSAAGPFVAAADDTDLEAGPTIPAQIVTITSTNVRVRGVLTGSTGASGVNLWLS